MAISLSTEDRLEYNFYPAASGQIQFRVKAGNDAHIALTTGPNEGEPMYEVFIGGWGNSRSVIRKNRAKPDIAEVETPGILDSNEFRGFWIRWNDGALTVGKEGEQVPLLDVHDYELGSISHFGVCTGWGATGEWLIEENLKLYTPDDLKYQFHPIRRGCLTIQVKAKSNAHIALTTGKTETTPMYEIMLGGWENTASVIRYDRKQPDKVRVNTPNLLCSNEHRKFTISWLDGHIVVRNGNQDGPVIIEWKDPNPLFGISHVGVRTGWGATGNWKLQFQHHHQAHPGITLKPTHPAVHRPSAPAELVQAGSVCWCDASGSNLPPGSVEGGRDGDEALYVGRASHGGALIPGKVKVSHGVCYVPWGGEEHGKPDYQVLCGCRPQWVSISGGNVPPNAIPGGETEEGEPLFVGRVHHEGTITIGKVQASHGVCYIPYGGQEVSFPDYEILVGQ